MRNLSKDIAIARDKFAETKNSHHAAIVQCEERLNAGKYDANAVEEALRYDWIRRGMMQSYYVQVRS